MQPQIVNRRLDILSGHITPQAGMIEGVDCAATAHSQADYDVIVFGAGAVGCAIAIALGKQGRKVLICERDMSEPDRIVGELLQPGAIDFLKQLGIEHVLDEVGGVAEKGYAVFYKGEIVHLPYPQGRQGCSFHFGKLIMSLRKAAQATPKYVCMNLTQIHHCQCRDPPSDREGSHPAEWCRPWCSHHR